MIRRNGDTLPTVLVDGYVSGVWRPVDGGVEITAFEAWSEDTWGGLEAEVRSLAILLDRDPRMYSRYQRWWADLPAETTRVLATSD